eukprot:scaffold62056_cov37-Tisochrysis_lutea.AAC.4
MRCGACRITPTGFTPVASMASQAAAGCERGGVLLGDAPALRCVSRHRGNARRGGVSHRRTRGTRAAPMPPPPPGPPSSARSACPCLHRQAQP